MTATQHGRPIDILLVEDNPGDVRLTREAFGQTRLTNDLRVVANGEDALAFLRQEGRYEDAVRPDLVLLDLNLPKVDGFGVLEAVKEDPDLKTIPVIVLTGSRAEEDVVSSYELHTNAYLTKPVDPDEFIALVRSLETFWFTQVELPSDAEA